MKIKQINLLLYACIGFMAIVNLISTNTLATKGIEINRLYQDSLDLRKDSQLLETKIHQHSKLSYIQEMAINQGFKRINDISLVSTTSLMASRLDTIYP